MDEQSVIEFYYNSLGLKYVLWLPFSALLALILTILLVWRGRGLATGAALVLAVLMPVFVGWEGTVSGIMASFQVISMSTTAPKFSQISEGLAMSLATLWIGLWLALPSYFVAVAGSLIRAVAGKRQTPL